jgi:hypothetical protein
MRISIALLIIAGFSFSGMAADVVPVSTELEPYLVRYGDSISVIEMRTDKVSYRSLSPQVQLTAVVKNPTFVTQNLDLEFRIEEPLTNKLIVRKKADITLPPKIVDSASVSLNVNVPQMTGLLAKVIVTDKNGGVLDMGMRPFDVTDDMRRNFRFAGAAIYSLSTKINPKDCFRPENGIKILHPEEEAELVYKSFQNSAVTVARTFRGEFTEWMESGDVSRLRRRIALSEAMRQRGIMPEMWMTTRRYASDYMDSRHPWIRRLEDGSPDFHASWRAFRMNHDIAFHHPLSPEEERMMASYSHGAVNWIDYLANEYILANKQIGCQSFWADNYSTAVKSFIPMIEKINKALGYKMFIKSNHNDKIEDDGITDVYWVEPPKDIENDMAKQFSQMREVLKRKRTRESTVMWANTHNGGPTLPYSDNDLSAEIVNNDPTMTHMYRQYLFESISMDPNLVHIQNTPRRFTFRYLYHTEAFEKHCKTWGFETLYIHLFNSPDIVVARDSSAIVSVDGLGVTYDSELQAGKLHVRVTNRPELNQTMIHIFNYIGTDITNLIKRPRPTRQEAVKLKVKLCDESKSTKVYAVSPDNDEYGTVIMPETSRIEDSIEFAVPVDTYTLVVIQ